MAACAETETVVNLHIGSSGTSPSTSDDAPPDVVGVLFFAYAMFAAVDWLYSKIPVRFTDLKICLSEGGIGWVAGLMDRLDHMLSYHEMYGTWTADIGLTPSEVLQRNFYYCAVEDPSSFARSWSGESAMSRTASQMFEYACHEANYSLPAVLRGERLAEQNANNK